MIAQQARETFEALRQALGIVQAVHADDQRAVVDGGLQFRDGATVLRAMRQFHRFGGVDADGEHPGAEDPAVRRADAAARAHRGAQLVQEVVLQRAQVALRVHAHQVVRGQRFEQLAVAGEGDQQARGRQRRVQEEPDPVFHALFAQHRGQRNQVVVVYPDDVVLADELRHALGEHAIHPKIAFEVIATVIDQVAAIVEQRPQRAIGEAAVIVVVIRLRHVDGGVADVSVLDLVQFLARLGGDVAAPAEPQTAHFL